jgi:AcrR family transcriptional regulator
MSPASTRERILEAAARLFHEQGYHPTGISTVLREAGVNSGSLYHFFPSKEDLLVGVLERYVALLRPEVLDPAEARARDPIARVFALLDLYREGLRITGFNMGCPIGNLALELSDNHPKVRRWIERNFENWLAGVAAWIEAARDRLPRDSDPKALAGFVLTVMEGAVMRSRAARSLSPFDESVARLREYFDLLLSPSPRKSRHAQKRGR